VWRPKKRGPAGIHFTSPSLPASSAHPREGECGTRPNSDPPFLGALCANTHIERDFQDRRTPACARALIGKRLQGWRLGDRMEHALLDAVEVQWNQRNEQGPSPTAPGATERTGTLRALTRRYVSATWIARALDAAGRFEARGMQTIGGNVRHAARPGGNLSAGACSARGKGGYWSRCQDTSHRFRNNGRPDARQEHAFLLLLGKSNCPCTAAFRKRRTPPKILPDIRATLGHSLHHCAATLRAIRSSRADVRLDIRFATIRFSLSRVYHCRKLDSINQAHSIITSERTRFHRIAPAVTTIPPLADWAVTTPSNSRTIGTPTCWPFQCLH
jgi:hypothetical protein